MDSSKIYRKSGRSDRVKESDSFPPHRVSRSEKNNETKWNQLVLEVLVQ